MKKTKIISINQLLPIFGQNIEQEKVDTVNAKDVYKFLEVKDHFRTWIQRNIKRYDFIEGKDYVCCADLRSKEGSGGHNIKEYYVSLDMAKELSMVQNNPRGKEARQYFIQCEKIAKNAIIEQTRQMERRANREWKQARLESKIARRTATDIYQEFVDHAIEQGTSNGPRWYGLLTERVYDAIIIPGGHMEIRKRKKELKIKNGRETLTPDELIKVGIMEALIVKKTIHEALKTNGFYKNDYRVITEKFFQYGEQVEKRLLLQTNNETPLLN